MSISTHHAEGLLESLGFKVELESLQTSKHPHHLTAGRPPFCALDIQMDEEAYSHEATPSMPRAGQSSQSHITTRLTNANDETISVRKMERRIVCHGC